MAMNRPMPPFRNLLSPMPHPVAASVTLHAPGRLHLGFLDPAGTLGRRYGSLGLALEGFETRVSIGAASRNEVSACCASAQAEVARAAGFLRLLQRHSGRAEALALALDTVLPAHAGFGSGTQLALAIGRAFAGWHRLDVGTPLLAQWLGRGKRSGIGIAGFEHGGLLLDGGPSTDGTPAPLLARIAMPGAWRVVVVQDPAGHGLSGANETQAIAALPPLPRALAADICHQALMRVLPGAASADFAAFASGVARIQAIMGEHFAPAQHGSAYTSAAVARVIAGTAELEPGAATGQSSWGPTGFAIVESQRSAEALVAALRSAELIAPGLDVRIVAARNHGAAIVDTRKPVPGH